MSYACRSIMCAACLASALPICSLGNTAALAATLVGSYGVTGTGTCLIAPGGFNDKNQPNDVDNSSVNTITYKGIIKYDGHGEFIGTLTTVNITTSNSSKLPPSASSSEVEFHGTYEITADGTVKAMPGKGTGKNLTGPRAGQTFDVNGTEFLGHISADGNTLVSGSQPKVTIVNLPNGNTISRICSEADIQVKLNSE